MKKILAIALVVLMLTACNMSTPVPKGQWKSEEPYLVINVHNDGVERTWGTYIVNGIEKKVLLYTGSGHEFIVEDALVTDQNIIYLGGTYEIQKTKTQFEFRLKLSKDSRERTGLKKITLIRISEIPEKEN